jgi:hypothetical protein
MTDCIEWKGPINGSGYGRKWIKNERKYRVAHLVLWEEVNGPKPPGMDLDHLCRNRKCVNLEHIELVTRSENARRGNTGGSDKTHCPKNHPYTGSNLYTRERKRNGKVYVERRCNECHKERERHRRKKG